MRKYGRADDELLNRDVAFWRCDPDTRRKTVRVDWTDTGAPVRGAATDIVAVLNQLIEQEEPRRAPFEVELDTMLAGVRPRNLVGEERPWGALFGLCLLGLSGNPGILEPGLDGALGLGLNDTRPVARPVTRRVAQVALDALEGRPEGPVEEALVATQLLRPLAHPLRRVVVAEMRRHRVVHDASHLAREVVVGLDEDGPKRRAHLVAEPAEVLGSAKLRVLGGRALVVGERDGVAGDSVEEVGRGRAVAGLVPGCVLGVREEDAELVEVLRDLRGGLRRIDESEPERELPGVGRRVVRPVDHRGRGGDVAREDALSLARHVRCDEPTVHRKPGLSPVRGASDAAAKQSGRTDERTSRMRR